MEVANYLTAIAEGERKLDYIRQILARNIKFVPLEIFNFNKSTYCTSLTKIQFFTLLKNLISQETSIIQESIFDYFVSEEKPYVAYDNFCHLIIFGKDPKIKQSVLNRKKSDFKYESNLKYTLMKYFHQIYQNKAALKLYQPSEQLFKQIIKKSVLLQIFEIKAFMANHGKYPCEDQLLNMRKIININAFQGKHRQIRNFVQEFNKHAQQVRKNEVTSQTQEIKQNLPIKIKNDLSDKQNVQCNNGYDTKIQGQDKCSKITAQPRSSIRSDIYLNLQQKISSIKQQDRCLRQNQFFQKNSNITILKQSDKKEIDHGHRINHVSLTARNNYSQQRALKLEDSRPITVSRNDDNSSTRSSIKVLKPKKYNFQDSSSILSLSSINDYSKNVKSIQNVKQNNGIKSDRLNYYP